MSDPRWSKDQLHGFNEAAQSLKLYRRAELHDAEHGDELIASLYVDPLPEQQALRTVLRPNTTFVIGRKGTGKSTVFQRLQYELRQSKTQTSAYVDIKTLFEQSRTDPSLLARLEQLAGSLPSDSLQKLLLYRQFLKIVIAEIKSELRKRVESSWFERIKERFTGSLNELFEGFDEIIEQADSDDFVSVLGVKQPEVIARESRADRDEISSTIGLQVSPQSPSGKAEMAASSTNESQSASDIRYADILMRTFNIRGLLERLKELLGELGIRNLYILIDDFSELPEEAMKVVVDVLLAPLNNWSDEFIKFKVAAYPGRVYYGDIDRMKIDELYLDLYKLYGSSDVGRMEESAIDFTRRLASTRLRHFCGCGPETFLESDTEEVWRQLFFATMANPRNLGWILHFLYESQLINGRPVGTRAIGEATRRYYEDKIESYFTIGKFLHESFEERSSIFGLKELLEQIVARAKELRSHESEVLRKIAGRPPTSHFHVAVGMESLLSTLELNFFLTKYYEMSDRDGKKVTVFALNYGLCQKYAIGFGRPKGEREFRLYFVERIFDYSTLLRSYMSKNTEIVCESCGAKYALEALDALKFYGMRCRECSSGVCRIINLSKLYEADLKAVERDSLLPPTELGILQTLHTEAKALRPARIAQELDCSYQLVGKRGRNLVERGLATRSEPEPGRPRYEITQLAEESYFAEAQREQLNVPTDEDLEQ